MPRASTSQAATQQNTMYSLSLLSEYTHTLDSLPVDLSRSYADLRELDAVLSSSMSSITEKIRCLTSMVEEGRVSKEEQLFMLKEIAEEASRLKLGGEDKIRVACSAADALKGHINHQRTLLEHLPSFDLSQLERNTTYPHVAKRSYAPGAAEGGGRRGKPRGLQTASLLSLSGPSPAKTRRVGAARERDRDRDDDMDSVQRTPRKEKTVRGRNGRGDTVRKDRGHSPAESVVSSNSHSLPAPAITRTASNNNITNGRTRARYPTASSAQESPAMSETYANTYAGVPPSTYHPSLGQPYNQEPDLHGWAGHTQLEGPGMPVARTTVAEPAPAVEADPDEDGKTYCICDNVSHGEMIGCDSDNCVREWFHLTCMNLTAAPGGEWFCPDCTSARAAAAAKRGGRGGKKKAGGRKAAGRA